MKRLINARNYIIVKSKKELELAKACDICRFIIWEDKNAIYIWTRSDYKWVKERYVEFDGSTETDDTVTGLKAYQSFYAYCGKEEVERMKHILTPIPMWDSFEQMHFANIDFAGEKIYQPIYEFDANSAFTYGTMQLSEGFNSLKDYMSKLFEHKKTAPNKIIRSRFKNLQNYLIGYFARIKDFVRVRSEIINESNKNIKLRMAEIIKNGGVVYLSNTDSIVTNKIGAEVMQRYIGDGIGQFKLELSTDKLFYKSPNAYQIGEKVVYSGVSYFARQHTNFFEDKIAEQKGSLIRGFEFIIDTDNDDYLKICKVEYGQIVVIVTNLLGEELERIYYKIGE